VVLQASAVQAFVIHLVRGSAFAAPGWHLAMVCACGAPQPRGPGAARTACHAETGRDVLGVDIDEGKATLLDSGKAWFREPGLGNLLVRNIAAGRVRLTASFAVRCAGSSLALTMFVARWARRR